jgi:hypothetical protein
VILIKYYNYLKNTLVHQYVILYVKCEVDHNLSATIKTDINDIKTDINDITSKIILVIIKIEAHQVGD